MSGGLGSYIIFIIKGTIKLLMDYGDLLEFVENYKA